MRTITLLTDFGTADWFVGTMKGVILSRHPRVRLVDLTHEISPGDIRAGAFALAAAYSFFPARTVHLAVVDPGVGSRRHALAVRTRRYHFVGPDNGLLSLALRRETILELRRLENAAFWLPAISSTFHGRDIFAPVAAHLSADGSMSGLGPELDAMEQLPWPEPSRQGEALLGEVVYIDRFGNAITNIPNHWAAPPGGGATWGLFLGRGAPVGFLASHYAAEPAGTALVVPGSSGYLEWCIHGASAARRFRLKVGVKVRLRVTRG